MMFIVVLIAVLSSIRCTFFSPPNTALIPVPSPACCLGPFSQSPPYPLPPSFTPAFSTRSSPNNQPRSCSHPCPLVSIYSPHPNHHPRPPSSPLDPQHTAVVVRSLTPRITTTVWYLSQQSTYVMASSSLRPVRPVYRLCRSCFVLYSNMSRITLQRYHSP